MSPRTFYTILVVLVITASLAAYAAPTARPLRINTSALPVGWGRLDRNNNYIDDAIEGRSGYTRVYILFESRPTELHRAVIEKYGGKILYTFRHVLNGYLALIPLEKAETILYVLRMIDANGNGYADVACIQGTRIYKPLMSWAAREGHARPLVWDLGYTGKGVRVAVLDTGIDLSTRGFNNSRVEFHDLVNGYTTPYDEVGHGTMVSYVIAGNVTPSSTYGESENQILTTYIDYIFPVTDASNYYITGPLMLTGDAASLEIRGYVTLYDSAAQGQQGFVASAYLVHYPGYTVRDFQSYDAFWALNISYEPLPNGYYLANLTLSAPISDPPKGLYYIFVRFSSGFLNYNAEVAGLGWITLLSDDTYWLDAGVAPEAGLVVFKVGDSSGVDTGLAAQALDTIAGWNDDNDPGNDVNIASMSFGGPSDDAAFHQAIRNAVDYGVLSVVAAGNDGPGGNNAGNEYPAAYPEVLTVAAVDTVGNITDYSSQGGVSSSDGVTVKPDIAAPGGSYYGPMTMKDSEGDGEIIFATGDHYEVTGGDLQTAMGTSFATPFVAGVAALVIDVFKEHGVWQNNALWVNITKAILMASAYETYPFIREKNPGYSPSLDYGLKDVHEGMGLVDAYAAVKAAEAFVEAINAVGEPVIIRDSYSFPAGPLYGVGSVSSITPSSVFASPVWATMFLSKIYNISYGSEALTTRYVVSLNISSTDTAEADYVGYVYMVSAYNGEPVLVARTETGGGYTLKTLGFTPPGDNYIYIFTVERARMDASAADIDIAVGINASAEYDPGSHSIELWAQGASPTTLAPYMHVLVYDSTGSLIVDQSYSLTGSRAEFNDTIALPAGSPPGLYTVVVAFTNSTTLSKATLVEGPVNVTVYVRPATALSLTATETSVYDNESFTLVATLTRTDDGSPLQGETIEFYEYYPGNSSSRLLGTAATNTTGEAAFTITNSIGGPHYYYAVYPGTADYQGSSSSTVTVTVYVRVGVEITVDKTTAYTIEPVTITATLTRLNDSTPLSGEYVAIQVSSDGGATWTNLINTTANAAGQVTIAEVFMVKGSYLIRAVYNGNASSYLAANTSSSTAVTIQLTPSTINATYNATELRVYDYVGFTIQLNYTLPGGTGPINDATVFLVLDNNDTVVDTATTAADGTATLTYQFTRNGTYTFHIYYPGNDTYAAYNTSTYTFIVKSLATTLTLTSTPTSGLVDEPITVTAVLSDERGRPIAGETVTLYRYESGTWVAVASNTTDTTGTVSITWSEAAAGTYTYKLVYGGRDYIYNASETTSFTVTIETYGVTLTLKAEPAILYAGETLTLIVNMTSNGTAVAGETIEFQAYIGGSWITLGTAVTNASGIAVYTTTRWVAGTVSYRAYHAETAEYSEAYSNTVNVTYLPRPVAITAVYPSSSNAGEWFTVTVTVADGLNGTPIANANVTVMLLNTTSYTYSGVTGSDGTAVVGVMAAMEGTYDLIISYPGNDTYAGLTQAYLDAIKIYAATVMTVIGPSTSYVNDEVTLSLHLEAETGTILANAMLIVEIYSGASLVANLTVYTNTSGDATVSYTFSSPGTYVFHIRYPGLDVYNGSEANHTVNVSLRPATVTPYTPTTVNAAVGSSVDVVIRVVDGVTSEPVSGMLVRVYVDDVYIGDIFTNATGYAVYIYSVQEGTHTIILEATGIVGGTQVYAASNTSFTITGVSQPTSITAYTVPSTIYVDKPFTIVAVLTSNGAPVAGETIEFYLVDGGETLLGTAVTNASGMAALTGVVFNAPGNYTIHVVYGGSASYLASDTYITAEARYESVIELNVAYELVGDNLLEITLIAKLYINGQPAAGKTIYFYKKGSWILLGTNTTNSSGIAVYRYTENLYSLSTTQLTYRADYLGDTTTYASREIQVLSLPSNILPAPEPPLLPVLLLAALVAMLIIGGRRRTR